MLNPVFAMLYNSKLDRWHPILFLESPLPGPPSLDKPVRHKSRGHHTIGFESREEAVESARESGERIEKTETRFVLDSDILWDGEGIPAIVGYFVGDGEDLQLGIQSWI